MTAAAAPDREAAEALAALARDRAAAYSLLAAAFRCPGPDLGEFLADATIAGAFGATGLDDKARALRSVAAATSPVELNIEHTRLFTGPRPAAPPYESVYRDPEGQVMGLATAAVAREYEAAGLIHDPRPGELPDHAAVELEFLHALCEEEVAAWAAGRATDAARWLERQRGFLEEHLLLWFSTFARRASAVAPHPFYRGLLDLAGAFLKRDEAWVGSLRRLVSQEAAPRADEAPGDA